MTSSTAALATLAILAAAPAARASPYCDAVVKAAGGAGFGFATVRGALVPEAHTSSFDVYTARVALPGATDCNVTVPHSPGLGPVS